MHFTIHLLTYSDVWSIELIVAAGFAGPHPQQSSQFGGSSAFPRPPNPNAACSSAFSSVIGSREDRGLRKSFGNDNIVLCFIYILTFNTCIYQRT